MLSTKLIEYRFIALTNKQFLPLFRVRMPFLELKSDLSSSILIKQSGFSFLYRRSVNKHFLLQRILFWMERPNKFHWKLDAFLFIEGHRWPEILFTVYTRTGRWCVAFAPYNDSSIGVHVAHLYHNWPYSLKWDLNHRDIKFDPHQEIILNEFVF